MQFISVLLVEDNPDDVDLICEFLAGESNVDFKVEVVTKLGDSIGMMNETAFDVVLLDLNLPDSTGLDTVRQLVGRFPEVAIIVLTGLADDNVAIQAVRFGAQDYLEKKYISSMWLGRAICYAVERKRVMRQKDALLADLNDAIEEVEMLRKIAAVCVSCKKIENDDGDWETLTNYLTKQAGSDCSHVVCPECVKAIYKSARVKNS